MVLFSELQCWRKSMSNNPFGFPGKIFLQDKQLLSITGNINLSNNIKNFTSRIKTIRKTIDDSLSETQRYQYQYNFANIANEDFVKKYAQDFFVVQPEIGIIVRYEFLPFIEFYRYVKKNTLVTIQDKINNNYFSLSLDIKPFWQNNNILEVDRFSDTELYMRTQRFIYPIKGNNKPYTEVFENTYTSNQFFEYDKDLHNSFREDLEGQFTSQIQMVQSKETQKEMLKRINDKYKVEGNQLIKFLIENIFSIQSLNLNDLSTNIILPILWKQYMITEYQKSVTQNQIQKIIDDYMELLYMSRMDESLIDFVTGKGYFNFSMFYNNLRETNDYFEKSFDPFFYKVIYQIDNYNYNSMILNLYNENEKVQNLYNLTIQTEQFLKGKINFNKLLSLLNEPDPCGNIQENSNLYYIPVGVNNNVNQEIEYQYSLYHDKIGILNTLYKYESNIYYKRVLLDNLDKGLETINDIQYYALDINEQDTTVIFRNIGHIYIGNQQMEHDLLYVSNILLFGDAEIGYVNPVENKFKIYIRKALIDSLYGSLSHIQYIKYDIDYDRSIINEVYNQYEFVNSTTNELIFSLRIQKNYKIRKGTIKIHIDTDSATGEKAILYDNHHGELVYVLPEPTMYVEYIQTQYNKFGNLIKQYDSAPNQEDNLEYIYNKVQNQILSLRDYLDELIQTTNTQQWEIFDKLRDYLIEGTMEQILGDISTVNSPVRDQEWVTKIIDDNLLSTSQNVQGYIDYKANIVRIDRNLIKYINKQDLDTDLSDLSLDLLDVKELQPTDISYTEYNYYDPKVEIHYILNCLLQEYDVSNLFLRIDQKTTNFILGKYVLNELNAKSLQDLETIHKLTYYRMIVGNQFITEIQYDKVLKIDKNTVYPLIFNKISSEIFEMNDYDQHIQKVNITFPDFMSLIKLTKIEEIEEIVDNTIVEKYRKNRILVSTQNSNILVKLLDQLNTDIKESQFYQQSNYIINEKRDLNVNKLYNFKIYDYSSAIISTVKDTNFIEYFLQYQINNFYNLDFFENKTKITSSGVYDDVQILKLEKLEFYIKQQSQTFYFEW